MSSSTNTSVGSNTEAETLTAPEPADLLEWSERAGPIFKYGIVVGLFLVIAGGASLAGSMTRE